MPARKAKKQTDTIKDLQRQDSAHLELIQQLKGYQQTLRVSNEELRTIKEELHTQTDELISFRAELDQIRTRYRELFDEAPDGYIVTDHEGLIQDANKAGARLLGHSKAHLTGYRRYRLFDFLPELGEEGAFRMLSALHTGSVRTSQLEGLVTPLRGKPFWAAITVSASRDRAGQVSSLQWLIRDISERKRIEEAAREHAALLDLADDAIIVRDQQDRVVFWSHGAEETYGWTSQEAEGQIAYNLLKTRFSRPLAELGEELAGKGCWEGELIHTRKDGRQIAIASRWAVKRDSSGRPVGILEINRDVTERKRAQESLMLSEERQRQAARVAGLGIFDHDHVTDTVEWSSEFRNIMGVGADAVITLPWWIAQIHPEDRTSVVEAIRRAHDPRSDGAYSVEHRVVRRDGAIRWVSVRSRTFFDGEADDRRPVRTIGAVLDITGLRESEAQLARELEEAKLLQSISAELLQKDNIAALYEKILVAAVRIMHSEYASIRMLCRERGSGGVLQLIACHGIDPAAAKAWEFVDVDSACCTCSEALRTGHRVIVPDLDQCDSLSMEDRHWFQQNGIRSSQSTPLFSRGGESVGVISTHWREPHAPSERELSLFDVLARQLADLLENERAAKVLRETNASLEKTVQKRTGQLSERAAQLRALARDLTVSEQRERQRLAQVLHDGLQQILVGAKFRVDVASRSREMRPALAQISELIDDAIQTSRSLTAELSPTILLKGDLVSVMEWLAHWMREKYELEVSVTALKKIDILAQDVIIILFQAVKELLFNVVKHAGVKTARIRLNQLEGRILIRVEDDGAGFDPKQLHDRDARSQGMGLFGIRERISQLGGRLRMESAPGRGSRFKLTIPCLLKSQTEETRAEQMAVPVSSHPRAEPAVANQIRIVLVDDHPVMRQGLAGLLRLEPGFKIVGEASDGAAAISLVHEESPDVVLMDVSMPGMDGIDATRIIHREHPEIRIIGLSMFNASEQAAAMREAGAVTYVTKSGPSEAVIEAIRSCSQQNI